MLGKYNMSSPQLCTTMQLPLFEACRNVVVAIFLINFQVMLHCWLINDLICYNCRRSPMRGRITLRICSKFEYFNCQRAATKHLNAEVVSKGTQSQS